MNKGPVLKRVADVALSLLREPTAIPIYLSTRRRKPLDVELPWINRKAILFLERLLRPDMTVFEYGSGGSTVFFARRCKHVISVEDDREWLTTVRDRLAKLGLNNAKVILQETDSLYAGSTDVFRRSAYLHAIDSVKPDIVLIDGADEWQSYGRKNYQPRRLVCFQHVEEIVVERGGIVLVDDALFYPELKENRAREVIQFLGVGPCRNGITRTDAFIY